MEREGSHPEPATDAELAQFLILHIDDPCGVEVAGEPLTLRDFYLREAERALDQMTDPTARERLQNKIRQYREP